MTDGDLKKEILKARKAQDAYTEAQYRRRIADHLLAALEDQGLNYREFAKLAKTSTSQVQRVLNKQRGGSLTLLTLVKAARALGLKAEELLLP